MAYKDLDKVEKKVQKALNKLISEEWMAGTMYKQMLLACKQDEVKTLVELVHETAVDEIDDHYAKLVKYAVSYGFDVPCHVKDYEKYASDACVKMFNNFKKDQDAGYYITQIIEAEKDAISSYEEILDDEELPQEFLAVVLPNYYDEIEHLENFGTLNIAYNASVQISM